jgi:glucose/mannose-6-phosphate isomerase
VSRLDDAAALREADPRGMLNAFLGMDRQLREAYDAARASAIPFAGAVRSVTFCAMGGSAAAGDVVASAFADRIGAPMQVLRGYRVPRGYGEQDLVLAVSYSGNTEETLAAHAAARERGCLVMAVCGGGALAERAREAGIPLVEIPAGAPVPRAGLGALTGGVVGALAGAGLVTHADGDMEDAVATLRAFRRELGPDVPSAENEAKRLASWVDDRLPLVWGSEGVSASAAWRWKTAFNENAEVPAFASTLPELDHHEIVGWTDGRGEGFRLVILREEDEHPTVQPRLDATLEEISRSGLEWREVRARGTTPLARALSLALVGDLASTYHALERGIDPAAMASLTRVKERLAEAPR